MLMISLNPVWFPFVYIKFRQNLAEMPCNILMIAVKRWGCPPTTNPMPT
nr:MAG TPA: hypothetical protein [Caudoviricetes sp.]